MASRRKTLGQFAAAAVCASAAGWSTRAFSATFLDTEQAQKLLLPLADRFSPVPLPLDEAALRELALQSHTRMPRGYAPLCSAGLAGAARAGWVMVDRTVGKYELIDFAAGFGPDGSATGVEIMAYRESHGAEIRNAAWRRQFAGRKGAAQMRFGEDIRNISGATLSCQHVTEGVQRLAVLAQMLALAAAGGR